MSLRDHFRPPLDNQHSWDELHGGWPMVIVQHLFRILPDGYVAAPKVHLGTAFEIDVSAYERGDAPAGSGSSGGGTATVPLVAPSPTHTLEADLSDPDEYEVRVYDAKRERRLVAAIEIVSPSNKDRPESRLAFAAKTAALLRQDVSASIVDLVTVRQFNLYAEVLDAIGGTDPTLGPEPPHLYAATLRARKPPRRRPKIDTWFYPLELGRPLPTLPLWLAEDLVVMLDLEPTYEDTCRVLHIA
jgi:uncharacterized protein DUF4058